MTTKITKEEFESMYNRMSLTELAKKLHVCRMTAFKTARKYGLPLKKSGGTKGKRYKDIKIDTKDLERLYYSFKTKVLAEKWKISIPTLVSIIKERGIKVKKGGRNV